MVALATAASSSAWAQTNRIGGVVRDETGAAIRGAIVRAATGGTSAPQSLTTATDDRGRFVFVVSRSGEWQITFEAPGFAPMTLPVGVRLAGPAPNLDVKLDRRETPEAFGALAGVDSKALSAQLAIGTPAGGPAAKAASENRSAAPTAIRAMLGFIRLTPLWPAARLSTTSEIRSQAI